MCRCNTAKKYLDLERLQRRFGDFNGHYLGKGNEYNVLEVLPRIEVTKALYLALPWKAFRSNFFGDYRPDDGRYDTPKLKQEAKDNREAWANKLIFKEPGGRAVEAKQDLGLDPEWLSSYNIQRGTGTFFASPFAYFLRTSFVEKVWG